MFEFLKINADLGVIFMCAVGVILSVLLVIGIKRVKIFDPRMNEISSFIKGGAMAYLYRQYKVLAVFLVLMFFLIGFLPDLGFGVAAAFLFGAILSCCAGYMGMRTAVISNVRTAESAKKGLSSAFKIAFSGGAVMGILVVSIGAFGVALVSYIMRLIDPNADPNLVNQLLTGFSLGASSVALFCRVGGGIYTKAADVGADLVGKVEAGIPEDDPKNPAVIADNVGDNVGDVAGMGADLFESYVGCIIAALLLAADSFNIVNSYHILLLVAGGLLASFVGIVITRLLKTKNASLSLNIGTYVSSALLVGVSYLVFSKNIYLFLCVLCGIVAGVLIGKLTEIYTSAKYKTVKKIAASGETGSATNILSGYAAGMKSTALPIIVIAAVIVISYSLGIVSGSAFGDQAQQCGHIGVVLAALGMLATVGMIVSVDAYGPIADNAGGIAQMSNLDKSVREITDNLDSVGNTTAAIGKGFSIGSAALTSLALIVSYTHAAKLDTIDIFSANVLGGLLIGGMLSYLFSALTINSVSKAANHMIAEVRRQFKEKKGIMAGTEKPDYDKCVDISTKAAIREMILPGIIAIVAPIVVGIIPGLGKEALAGLLIGATVTGVLQAISMSNSGGAWDNAKKYVEEGHHGGKNSEAHKASVIGDTVGDPLKDTAGPSLNILIKLMSIVAVVFAPLFLK
ncbi:MAG: sodium-translocating pyrophosphatase [Clostridia bacterium]|nr:sodium-translocating pyrophosphatase [Clostridia bacterium]